MAPTLRPLSNKRPRSQTRGETSRKTRTSESRQGSSSENRTLPEPQEVNPSELLPAPEPFEWTTERAVQLLFSMHGLKPAGIHKHLHVMLIQQRLNKRLKMIVPIKEIWRFLHAHWNLELADQIESYGLLTKKKSFEEEVAKFI